MGGHRCVAAAGGDGDLDPGSVEMLLEAGVRGNAVTLEQEHAACGGGGKSHLGEIDPLEIVRRLGAEQKATGLELAGGKRRRRLGPGEDLRLLELGERSQLTNERSSARRRPPENEIVDRGAGTRGQVGDYSTEANAHHDDTAARARVLHPAAGCLDSRRPLADEARVAWAPAAVSGTGKLRRRQG
jgi:hypothetical protein